MKSPSLPLLLSFNGGYVDTLGFLALSGLFTAHVTGNFVTFGATVALGTAGALPKLLALPVFCVVVFLSRLAGICLQRRNLPVVRPLLFVKFLLLAAVGAYALYHGTFVASESLVMLVVGMTLVSAMAIQNAVHRAHFPKAPPSTLMTGTTTQIMLDLADLLVGVKGEQTTAAAARIKRMIVAVIAFAVGCGLGALGFIVAPAAAFVVPAVTAALGLFLNPAGSEG
ncbi:hypothetical protein A6U87_08700 [Rhizobium sp. AC44/96]|uniref:YoaK family protein n=1 Tax=unclassified Rhizobium TaxID=2613769 RepID=UPI00080FA916|nr:MULTISPECIES: YoaK family protein [unclassified Rhizobium]MDM9622752.1 YoaK family protein [Rhizobium sp. S96]OCJ13332.1 hypothetical protein A6U87_08700 [Rhizobium sp. AC44/96]